MAVSTGTAILGAAGIGALANKGGGGGNTQSTQTSYSFPGQQWFVQDVVDQARWQANRTPYNYVANQSPFTRQAQNLTAQRALDPNSLIGRSQGVLGDTISGQYLSPESNPALRASVQDALGLAGSAFAKQYGGAAGQNLGNSGYQEALARGLGATATNAYADAYGRERQNQLNAMQLAPQMDFANLNALAGVGAQQEALAHQQYNSPWENLQKYQAALGNTGGTTTTQTPYFQNPLATAMGMGIGGLSLYNGMNQANMFAKSPFQSNADLAAMYNF
jgi:hypothetical protein